MPDPTKHRCLDAVLDGPANSPTIRYCGAPATTSYQGRRVCEFHRRKLEKDKAVFDRRPTPVPDIDPTNGFEYRTVPVEPIQDFFAICETMDEFDASHPDEYAALEAAKAAMSNKPSWAAKPAIGPDDLTESQVLCLRYLLLFSMHAGPGEEWPDLEALVERGFIKVEHVGEGTRVFETTAAGKKAVERAMKLKGETKADA